MKLTVFFDGQFWVGVVEAEDDTGLKVARHLFGAEPTDTEVFAFALRAIPSILEATPIASPGEAAASVPATINPSAANVKQQPPYRRAASPPMLRRC